MAIGSIDTAPMQPLVAIEAIPALLGRVQNLDFDEWGQVQNVSDELPGFRLIQGRSGFAGAVYEVLIEQDGEDPLKCIVKINHHDAERLEVKIVSANSPKRWAVHVNHPGSPSEILLRSYIGHAGDEDWDSQLVVNVPTFRAGTGGVAFKTRIDETQVETRFKLVGNTLLYYEALPVVPMTTSGLLARMKKRMNDKAINRHLRALVRPWRAHSSALERDMAETSSLWPLFWSFVAAVDQPGEQDASEKTAA